MFTASPNSCGVSAAARPWCWARYPRAPAMRKSRSINPAKSISSSPPMRSAWASTWMSTMWRLPRSTSSTACGVRPLRAEESGQIAGRAGRHMNDGTFGVTGDCEPLDEDMVTRLESHRYEPVRLLQFRNSQLDFFSPERVARKPRAAAARTRSRQSASAMDYRRLARVDRAGGHPRAGARAGGRAALVGSVPDPGFPQIVARRSCAAGGPDLSPSHERRRRIPEDWFARQIARRRRNRRRCGDIVRPSRADPHLDLCRPSSRLAAGSIALAGADARHRRPFVRCAA